MWSWTIKGWPILSQFVKSFLAIFSILDQKWWSKRTTERVKIIRAFLPFLLFSFSSSSDFIFFYLLKWCKYYNNKRKPDHPFQCLLCIGLHSILIDVSLLFFLLPLSSSLFFIILIALYTEYPWVSFLRCKYKCYPCMQRYDRL